MFYVKDCPDDETVDRWLMKKSGMDISNDKYKDNVFVVNLDLDRDKLAASAKAAYEKHGWFGFVDIFSTEFKRQNVYGGLSLTYDKDFRYPDVIPEIHAQTLGFPRTNIPNDMFDDMSTWKEMIANKTDKSFFYNRHNTVKHTYNDTYAFRHHTPAVQEGYIGEITSKIKRSLVRSRLASFNPINAGELSQRMKDRAWHRDGSWFTEMRLNINVTSIPETFTLQMKDDTGLELFYDPGKAYVWDTAEAHAYFANKMVDFLRINLVYAISPWFDYIEEEDAWIPNEFFNKKHPIDMLMDGDVIDMDFTYEQFKF
jgi:hypothetical protein